MKTILVSAQAKPVRGDIEANFADHYRLIVLAVQKGANLIAFPESLLQVTKEKMRKKCFWNNKGELVSQMNDSDSGLLLLENQNDNCASQIIK
jgi:predicted amidohydrolase